VGRGGLDADAEGFAGGGERRGQVDLAPVDDDRLGHYHRPGGCALEPFVQAHQPCQLREWGVGEAQGVGPGGAGRVRDGHLREQQGRIDGLGAGGAQDGGEDGAGGDVDGDREFGPAGGAVVEDGEDVQPGGVDPHSVRVFTLRGEGQISAWRSLIR
jgi:hypothetical protein